MKDVCKRSVGYDIRLCTQLTSEIENALTYALSPPLPSITDFIAYMAHDARWLSQLGVDCRDSYEDTLGRLRIDSSLRLASHELFVEALHPPDQKLSELRNRLLINDERKLLVRLAVFGQTDSIC